MPKAEQFEVISKRDGLRLSVMRVTPDQDVKGVLQMAHGMAEHKERFLPMMTYLADKGFVCEMNDHRGHGKSLWDGEKPGYFGRDGGRALVDDLHQRTLALRADYPNLPLFLYGHSMGSLAVRAYRLLYEEDIDGLIVCGSPGPNPARGAGRALVRALSALGGDHRVSPLVARMVGGSFARRFPNEGSEHAWLSTDRGEVEKYDQDPLCGFPFTLNGYAALLDLMEMAYRAAPARKPELPVHFISGEDDPCMPDRAGFEAALSAARASGLRNVTAKVYPGMRHEIHNERDRAIVYEELARTLEAWTK